VLPEIDVTGNQDELQTVSTFGAKVTLRFILGVAQAILSEAGDEPPPPQDRPPVTAPANQILAIEMRVPVAERVRIPIRPGRRSKPAEPDDAVAECAAGGVFPGNHAHAGNGACRTVVAYMAS
jgi:hypothetical protein